MPLPVLTDASIWPAMTQASVVNMEINVHSSV